MAKRMTIDANQKASMKLEENWQRFSPYTQDTIAENPRRRVLLWLKILTGIGLTALALNFIDMVVLNYDNELVNVITLVVADLFIGPTWAVYFELLAPKKHKHPGKVPASVFIIWTLGAILFTLVSIFVVLDSHEPVDPNLLQIWIFLNVAVALPWCWYSLDVIFSALRDQNMAIKDDQRYSTTIATAALCVSILNLTLIMLRHG